MSDHQLRGTWLTEAQIDYLRRVRRSGMTAAEVPAEWRQHRVASGIVARSCSGLDHAEVIGCWSWYPDQLPGTVHD